ncbi:ATP-dependent DNA helicase RecG [Candidatus Falkowbacteria bacterium]|nr:ATP-dependent DNA helicase RecG [Patescibacteria group bacterium]NCU43112.1 ATP-dependent DNA helicase RecG [Candidatus Falkowbacteria bacterium]
MLNFDSPLSSLHKIGTESAKKFAKLGLKTVGDLLFYIPFRYDDFSIRREIGALKIGETANVVGTIDLIQNRRSRQRRLQITEALLRDESGFLKLIWFNQGFLTRNLKVGDQISVAGLIESNNGTPQMTAPDYEKISSTETLNTSGLVPHYLSTAKLTQKQIRQAVNQALPLAKKISDWVPVEIRKRLNLLDLKNALCYIHRPASEAEISASRQRLAFSDLFLRQLKSQTIKNELGQLKTSPIPFQKEATQNFVAKLPFKLTDHQRQAAWEIIGDLEKTQPMSRLLEGDVGSGKTVVAAIAFLNVILAGRQGVIMAPTEVLAAQHYQTFSKLFKNQNFKVALLTANYQKANFTITPKLADKKGKQILREEADLIIGTQALIQPGVSFPRLGLAVVDEQHRFGVNQRHQILGREENWAPHFLSMTATPIPRSLALTIYSDLDLSIITQQPAARQKIKTFLVDNKQRIKMEEHLKKEMDAGHQIFVICPLVENSDKLEVKSAKDEYRRLQEEVFPKYKVGLLHGRLKAKDKEDVLMKFANQKLDILVSTSVIEVGIDFPNATVIVIEGADRFGLAQLHQFRGRVGRGQAAASCFLLPSKENIKNPKTLERLTIMTKTDNGLKLAEKDLELRGSGDLFGQLQSGFKDWHLTTIFNLSFLKAAKDEATRLIKSDPNLIRYPQIKARLGEWEKNLHLE